MKTTDNNKYREDNRTQNRTWLFASFNLVGALLYILLAPVGWVEPEVADIPGAAGGGALIWFMFIAPVVLLSFAGNIISLCWSLYFRLKYKQWPIRKWGYLCLMVLPLVIWIDFMHHGK